MRVLCQDGLPDGRGEVLGEQPVVHPRVDGQAGDVLDPEDVLHLEVDDGLAELDALGVVEEVADEGEGVHGEGGHEGLGPAVAAVLDLLLELDPSEGG